MLSNDNSPIQVIIYEGKGASPLADETRLAVLSQLLDKGFAVALAKEGGREISAPTLKGKQRLLVLGDFAGDAPSLEDASGQASIETVTVSGLSADEVLGRVEQFREGQPMNEPGKWKPWFPVIDYDRCTNCMQCLSFCLFDVYGVDTENRIQVQNNDNCKTNCPACSRVCPEVAIMFPKYSGGPINGDKVNTQDLEREKMKVDISSLLGGDIYASLRTRSEQAKSRFSKERSPDKALSERKKCLTKLQQDGMIPAEVLENLPSPEEILRRAAAAAAKADVALKAQTSAN
ncbi:MAG: ferredoxin family protein [Verrucomicrobia bacterium]|nr:ferredoxin family protein [Verrucomicrobiota bacterium]